MARLLRMPEVIANATEAVLQEWAVTENSQFSAAETIATVETEKAIVDVEADADGVILKLLVPNGSQVEVGTPIAVLGEPGEKVDDLDAVLTQLGVSSDAVEAEGERLVGIESGRLAGDGSAAAPNGHSQAGRIFTSPLARRLAKRAGLDVRAIVGTGPGGRIIRRDVDAAIADRPAPLSAAAQVPPVDVTPVGAAAGVPQPYVDVPHSRMRRAIASRLTESKRTIPHFYLRATMHVDRLLSLREELNESGGVRISVNDMVIKAAARAHTLVPAMNVIWTPDAVRSFSSVDVAVAVATDKGLVTPVLRAVEQMSISTVATTVTALVERAKAGRLRQEELEGGAFSITNLGMFGTEEFAAIINPPQSAILAVGVAKVEPIVKDGALTTGAVMRVTLSVDHRAVDGVVAAKWMRAFVSLVEKPAQVLA